jgi:hypothetical protein
MTTKKKAWHRARGRPPTSQRLRPEDCAIINANKLDHATLDQFTPFYENLMQYGRIPEERERKLYSRMIDASVDWPSGSRVALQLEVVATRQHFGSVRKWFRCPQCGGRVRRLYSPDEHSRFA